MIKTGIFKDIRDGSQYVVVINVVQNKGERIELYKNAEDYTPIDTYNAVGAYYRKSREYVYGNDDLIRDYLSTYNACVTLNGEVNQTTSFTPEGFTVTQTKTNELLGISSKVIMVNGFIREEEYRTNNYIISIDTTGEANTTVFVDPLNIKEYRIVSILSDFSDSDTVDADYYSLDYLKSKYNLDHIENYDYVIVEDIETARERLDKWRNAKVKLKSVDIESTGLNVSIFGEDLITGVVMSYDWEPLGEVENSTYFPFRQKNFKYNLPMEFLKEIADAINEQQKAESVDPLCTDGHLILAHNGKMERRSFWQDQLDIRVDVDTYTLSTLIETRMQRGLHTLKNRAHEATNLEWLELDMVFKNKLIRFDILPPEIVKYYACPDTPNTIRVFKHLMKKLPKTEYAVFEIENDLQRCKSINEYYGLRLDQEGLISRLKNVEFVTEHLSTIFKKWHKTSKNINSADVLRHIVYTQLGCKVVVRTKKNKPSTSADAIKDIVDHGKIKGVDLENEVPADITDLYGKPIIKGKDLKANKYPSLVILATYNKYKKELGALRRLQKKSIQNRVMFGINGTGAASGRQTSDAHQYSDTMKALVLSDTPDHDLVSCDYAQVELRILAYIIQDKRLIEQMKNKFIDIHRAFLNVITGIEIYLISALMRSAGKFVNFGVVYGISEYGLARNRFGPNYTKEQLLECKKAITDFFNGIPGCKDLADKNRQFVFEKGYIETEFGYQRHFPEVFNKELTEAEKARVFRAANNTPVQGFGAHLLKQAEINFDNYIKNKGWDKTNEYMGKQFPMVRVMLSIHDEVLISAHKSIPKEEIILMCKLCMEIEIPGAPPFFAVPTFVENWYQGKSDEFEMSIAMRDDILEAWEDGNRTIVDWNNLVGSIKDYKLNQIKAYMDDLIRVHKTEEEVIKHVNHPEFTHLLIAIYVTKDQVKSNSHVDCIALAVKAYMENADNVVETIDHFKEHNENIVVQDAISYLKEVEDYIEIDDSGQAIIPEEIESDLTEEDLVDRYAQEKKDEERFTTTTVGVVYLGNIIIIDTTDIGDIETLRSLHREVLTMCSDNGYYQINYMRGGEMMPTQLRMDPNIQQLQSIYDKYVSKEGVK